MNGYSQSPFANIPPVVKNLLIINIIFFLATWVIDRGNPLGWLNTNLAVYYFNSPHFRVWQIITYMFMHGGFMHIFFNMFLLFSFGPTLEYTLGSKKFFNFYFICGLGAIAFQMVVQALEVYNITGGITVSHPGIEDTYLQYGSHAQQLFEIYNIPMVGASGALFGLLVAFAMLYPNLELMIIFIPIPVKAKYVIPVYIAFEIFSGVSQRSGDNVAHFAHLGGALLGFILVKAWRLQNPRGF